MTVMLQTRDVRAAIYCSSGATGGAPGAGLPTTSLLGRIFHETFASLVGPEPALNFHAAIDEVEPELEEWQRALINHTYHKLIGPRLQQQQALLHHVSEQVLTFWDAVQALCRWLTELLWNLRRQGDEDLTALDWLHVEHPIAWEIREPHWTDSVRLTGIADAVWRSPENNRWIVIELKTGRMAPEADLAQVCLYHLMLQAAGEPSPGGMALVGFEPDRTEKVFTAAQLAEAQKSLIQLVGRMAGVIPEAKGESPIAEKQPSPRHLFADAIEPRHEQLGARLVETFREYGVEVRLDRPAIAGPAFLRFPITLGERVKLRAVERLAKEVQVRLQLDAPPRIGTEGGRVVVDLQRPDRQVIHFSTIRDQLPASDPLTGCSQVPLGVDIGGTLQLIDFARPEDAHLLVAGSTGSGKSEWLRAALAGLVLTNSPATLQLLLIDPKRNAFHHLRHSSFLYCPLVFPDEQPVAEALSRLADEMDRRYQLFSEHGDDSLLSYVRRTGSPLPRIFCVCDEYADLIMGDRLTRRAIEQQITRLGQKARAAGIHLILATQQPSREIIRGVLDANIPARIGLKMQKAIESKMLLNSSGAENLLGRGDLLFKDVGEPIRLQGVYLSNEEAGSVF